MEDASEIAAEINSSATIFSEAVQSLLNITTSDGHMVVTADKVAVPTVGCSLGELNERVSAALNKAVAILKSVPKENNLLLPDAWLSKVRSYGREIESQANAIKQAIENQISQHGPFQPSPSGEGINLTNGSGQDVDLKPNLQTIFAQTDNILEAIMLLPNEFSAEQIGTIVDAQLRELGALQSELFDLRSNARRASTEIENKKNAAIDAAARIEEHHTTSKQNLNSAENAHTSITASLQATNEAKSEFDKLSGEIASFRDVFEAFRKELSVVQQNINDYELRAKSIDGNYEARTNTLNNLENKAKAALEWTTTSGLASQFSHAERNLRLWSQIAFWFLLGSVFVVFCAILYVSGFDFFGYLDASYYRQLNMKLAVGELGPLNVILIRLGLLTPAILLFLLAFTIYVRLDGERKLYTHKRTMAAAAAGFIDLVQDEGQSEEAKRMLAATFENLLFNPAEAAAEVAKTRRMSLVEHLGLRSLLSKRNLDGKD